MFCSPISEDKTAEAIEKAQRDLGFIKQIEEETATFQSVNITTKQQTRMDVEAAKVKNEGLGVLGLLIIGFIAWATWSAFGNLFKATQSQNKETNAAQDNLSFQVINTLNEFPRIDVRRDYSVYVYVSKDAYMRVPYPDRDTVNNSIAKAWCQSKDVIPIFLPTVELRDIRTGKVLSDRNCAFLGN